MKEFELLPTEEEISAMAKEYNLVKSRNEVCNTVLCADKFLRKRFVASKKKCGYSEKEINLIAQAYFVQCDLVVGLRALFSLAPVAYRSSVEDIIKTKKQNGQKLLELYQSSTNKELKYAPRLINNYTYCVQLKAMDFAQHSLLFILNEIDSCNMTINRLINSELMLASYLTRLSAYCR